ncbi:phage shock envelope stress response protein PspM [Stackebrandtia nassauensis]|uniref:Uncharacterized protein n=1 Tax=Stackebrandtia nassauensis (strain DSM 44728 / CIP 108903 / NRRL B-16338 / NBRC 102104 / LLR-40K-21) TaxID=446470 RepID=D3Q2H3_STANL|nr:hypothetical protein [Stackebrandtia nassauensis]ADD43906.1 hypothetical protein Snas_4257 [Stackebrandtia nassauensis DSM 44728]
MGWFGSGVPQSVKRLRRRLRSARRWSVMAGIFGGASGVLVPLGGLSGWDAIWTALFGGSAVLAAFKWTDYRKLAKALPAENEQLAVYGTAALSAEAQNIAGAIAGKVRRGRMAVQYRNSAASHGWQRLEAAALAFDEIAPRLAGPAADTLVDVRESQRALRDLADQIRSVEKSVNITPPDRRGSLTETHGLMVERFETGVSAYEDLVGAAAQVVAEQGALDGVVSGEDPTMTRLNEATSKLSGLAEGIGQMREFHTGVQPRIPPQT